MRRQAFLQQDLASLGIGNLAAVNVAFQQVAQLAASLL